MEPPERAYIATSNNGGRTWTKPSDVVRQTIDDATAQRLGISFTGNTNLTTDVPMLVVGSDGTAYALVMKNAVRARAGQPPNKNRIFMLRSTDGGKTSTAKVISPGHGHDWRRRGRLLHQGPVAAAPGSATNTASTSTKALRAVLGAAVALPVGGLVF